MPRTDGSSPETAALERRLREALPADYARLRARLRGLARTPKKNPGSILARIARDIDASAALWSRRRDSIPTIDYPHDLPVSQKRGEIAEAIRDNQVVVVCGETGSGKTTQLPKICLELGRGVDRTIGHTQPRRIAARSVAARIAEELRTPLGGVVGYKVRFGDQSSPESLVKLMTDGILLAETQGDRNLNQYDTLIIDEAHERSLNIDFLLGYLCRLLPKRPDLKIVITSATIDPQRFSEHFAHAGVPAPIIEVSGRTYPVEHRYRPLVDPSAVTEETLWLYEGVAAAIDECCAHGHGDVLVFMPGEREIRETAETLRKKFLGDSSLEVLPLYARLSPADQQRIFKPHTGRRVIVSTNVAETSLTVPGIHYVVDPGTARISRYSARSKVQGLEIEAISQASANQRAGRCGRLGPGVCVRLYSEEDFRGREEFTSPEISRTNLASVVLQMAALKLGRPEDFPFVEPPDPRLIRDGYETLRELGAIDDDGGLTAIGAEMARLPIDPRIARMVLAAREEDCLREVLIIATALSAQDPRDRPMDKRDEADEAHEKFRDERSDFLDYLNIWAFYHEQSRNLSRSKLQKACAQNFLSARRLNEWREVYRQVRALLIEMGHTPRHTGQGEPADYDKVHRALLSGLLTSVGKKGDGFEYEGPRGSRFHIFPGSGQFEARPKWVMAAEIVRTTRVYARTIARIEPEWIETVGSHQIKRSHSSPRWDERSARVMADEKVSLIGLEIIPRRAVHFGPVDPASSRELFIHHALVEDEYQTRSRAIEQNRRLVNRIAGLEDKARRRDILADAQTRFAFYDKRLPTDVYSGQTLERWLKRAEERDPDVLVMRESDLVVGDAASVSTDAYPARLGVDGDELKLKYMYNPGESRDGVTLEVPVEKLGQVRREETDWVVPGLRAEKIEALMRTMPKGIRRHFDIRPVALELAGKLRPGTRTMLEELADALAARVGVRVSPSDFRPDELGEHLSMNYRVTDAKGKTLGEGRDLPALRRELAGEVKAGFDAAAAEGFNRDGLTVWDFDELPEHVESKHAGRTLRGYPALADLDGKVGLRLFDSPEGAAAAMRGGLARLYVHHLKAEMRYRAGHLPGIDAMRLWYAPIGDAAQLERDLLLLIADRVFVRDDAGVRTREAFAARIDQGWNELGGAVEEVCTLAATILKRYNEVAGRMGEAMPPAWSHVGADMRVQLERLIYPGFLAATPFEWLRCYPRYLAAMLKRLEKLRTVGHARDLAWARDVYAWWVRYEERRAKHEREGTADPELARFRWLLEEFRVSLFAQELGTSMPVSAKRLEKQWERVRV